MAVPTSSAGQEGEQPLPPQHLDIAEFRHRAGRRDRAGARENHLVEQVAGVGHDQEHAARDVAALAGLKRLDQCERYGGEDRDPRQPGRNDEGQDEIGHDEAEQDPGIGRADAQHDRIGEPAREARLAGDAPQQQGREQEPGGVVGEAAEGHVETHHPERPEQEAADEAGERELHGLGHPGHDHETHDRQAVLRLRRKAERREPHGERHHYAQEEAERAHPRDCDVGRVGGLERHSGIL